MKVLVTGGLGYIGSHTCVALRAAGFAQGIYSDSIVASIALRNR